MKKSWPGQEGRWPVFEITVLVDPTFCYSCKWFAKFCKEMLEKLFFPE